MRCSLLLLLAACSSDPASPDTTTDASVDAVTEPPVEKGAGHDAIVDASSEDAAREASPSDGGECHTLGFGGVVVNIAQVQSLPNMTGGSIALGAYDAVEAKTTGSITGTYRGSWYFEASARMQILEQVTLSGSPPAPVPRTLEWSTSATSLTRKQVCGGSQSFTNEYTARTDSSGTFLDVRSGGLLFTFKKRP